MANCLKGVGIESGLDGYATYNNCSVTGDTSSVSGESILRLNGDYPSGMRVERMKFKASSAAVSGVSFAAQGNDTFEHSGGGTLSQITGGYDKQEITIIANAADMTFNVDWPNVGGFGANRMFGNGNVDFALKAGGMVRARYRGGVGWHLYAIGQVQ